MSFKNILVHIDNSDRCDERLRLAGNLAKEQGAHLTGLFVIPEKFYPLYMDSTYIPSDLIENQEAQIRADCDLAEKHFRKFADHEGLTAEWRSDQGPIGAVVARHARYADVTVLGQGSLDEPAKYPNPFLAADVVMTAGRPVLVIPNAGQCETIGKRIMVCWNASRESVRALNDAMPLLKKAENVTVLVVNPQNPASGDHGDIPSADIALYLARHGIKAEAASTMTDINDVGEVVLSRAFDLDIDLIVCGAYGHSRTREWILGGVTETLIHQATIPTFMSH
jgi:nucleotide-binding universal stress UspA family protein